MQTKIIDLDKSIYLFKILIILNFLINAKSSFMQSEFIYFNNGESSNYTEFSQNINLGIVFIINLVKFSGDQFKKYIYTH